VLNYTTENRIRKVNLSVHWFFEDIIASINLEAGLKTMGFKEQNRNMFWRCLWAVNNDYEIV